MSLFKWANEEERKGSPLFAAMLGGAAAGVAPLSNYLDKTILRPGLKTIGTTIGAGDDLNPELVAKLKEKTLDKDLREKLHIIKQNKKSNAFVKTKKNYLPKRSEVEKFLREGGIQTAEGKVNPIKAIKDIRGVGGFIRANEKTVNPVTLAHELGHATSLNKDQLVRNSKVFRYLDSLGRSMQRSGSRGALGAAILAGSFDSDDNTKYLVPAGIALTQAPLLAEEGIASLRGLDALKSLKDVRGTDLTGDLLTSKAVQDNARKYLGRAFGTYGLGAAGLLAAPLLAMGARSQLDAMTTD